MSDVLVWWFEGLGAAEDGNGRKHSVFAVG